MKNNHSPDMNQSLELFKGSVRDRTSQFFNHFNVSKEPSSRPSRSVDKPEVLLISSYPPRECGLATYSHDLVTALKQKFGDSFSIRVCALETEMEKFEYPEEVKYTIDPKHYDKYEELAETINRDNLIQIVLLQHEFGFFLGNEEKFTRFLRLIDKPVIIVLHTVLPDPSAKLKILMQRMICFCETVIVMTYNSQRILMEDYQVLPSKISVIPHGTHLVPHLDKNLLKEKYGLSGRMVFSTFGLLSSGKNIETTLDALPEIIRLNPDMIFLIIGKTHPSVVRSEGEQYRKMLIEKVEALQLQDHVRFINQYLQLPELLDYLQLMDIYLFTSNDRNQAVSGTFSYAISCGCPVISTPIPHVLEVLGNESGIIIDFENATQLAEAGNRLLGDQVLRENMASNGIHRMASSAWENTAIAHAILFDKIAPEGIVLEYNRPAINLCHIKKMTTDIGIIQFSKINRPDLLSGYTLDDNARALIAICMHFELTGDEKDLSLIETYLNFIQYCQQPEGDFLNYINSEQEFTAQNDTTNLDDSNGRAIWALGYLIASGDLMPVDYKSRAEEIINKSLLWIQSLNSTRAMAFAIKGLYFSNRKKRSRKISELIRTLANRLIQMYRHESEKGWEWFESYLTYANSILPEALLCAFDDLGDETYVETAKTSFDFLLSIIFREGQVKVVSNQGWQKKGKNAGQYGEQPIDVAYCILALARFYDIFRKQLYLDKMKIAFEWFLGKNHLHQIIYNPCTGGCYDGLEENHINLNQGAESTVSYLLSRLTVENYLRGSVIRSSVKGMHNEPVY